MNIPADVVIRKMEEELNKLKASVGSSSNSYQEHAHALKTYCELLLETNSDRRQPAPVVQHATVSDVKKREGNSESFETSQTPSAPSERKRPAVYDKGDKPESDSLFDF